MDAQLRFSSNVLAFADTEITSDPTQRYVDWSRSTVVDVENPQQYSRVIAPGDTLEIFSGVRATSINGTTEFDLTLSTLSEDRYRFTYNGTGANPAFRTNRNLTPNGHTLTWVVNINETLTLTSSQAGEFSAVQSGDVLFVPGVSTGDSAGPFNVLNEGFWEVVSATGTTLQLVRPDGTSFSGYSQVVVSTANSNLMAYSAAGVQVGDTVDISIGFSSPVLKAFTIDRVTPGWFEIISTSALPVAETGAPTASGMLFYSNAKRFIKIESDQECIVRVNGDTSNYCRVSPWTAGDSSYVGEFVKVGPTWSLSVVNRSSSSLNLTVITVE